MLTRRNLLGVLIAAGCVTSNAASAQSYPTKPIRIVVGFAAGGPADVMARLIGQRLGTILGQTIVVDNRPGAGGTIGARSVAEADPDGYTLLLGNTSTLVIGPLIYRNVNYDPIKNFAAVALLGTTSNLLVVPVASPAKSVRDLIALAKASPGKTQFLLRRNLVHRQHLIGEMFKQKAGVDIVHVPYKGGGPSLQAVVAGETQLAFENPAIALPLAQAGTVKALAVTSETRSRQAPDLPTMIEAGVPDFASVSFTAIVAPAGTPAPIVNQLNAAINESLKSPEISDRLVKLAVDAKISSPAEFAEFLARERDKWTTVVKAAKVQVK